MEQVEIRIDVEPQCAKAFVLVCLKIISEKSNNKTKLPFNAIQLLSDASVFFASIIFVLY